MALYNEEVSLEIIDNDSTINPIKEIGFGAISGMFGKVVEYPFDTIKVRLQSSALEGSTLQCIQETYKREGFLDGFYKGLRAPLVGACFETAILFSTYSFSSDYFCKMLNTLEEDLPLWAKCVSGGNAGLAASFILTPIELIKCRLQVENVLHKAAVPLKNSSNIYAQAIKNVVKTEGITGLWRGLSSTLIREISGTALWFGSYEFMNRYLKSINGGKSNDLQLMASGAFAGVVFNSSTFPIDTIKSNIQTKPQVLKDKSIYQVAKIIYVKDAGGVFNFYKGLPITIARAIPANAIIFYSYELLKRNL